MTRSIWVVVAFAVALLAFNARYFTVSYAEASEWLSNPELRLPNVRIIPEECRAPFIREFIARQDFSKPTMLVFGDSQAFNSGVPGEKTWPVRFNDRSELGLQVVNLAILDGRLQDTRYIAEQITDKVALSVINLNQSHFSGSRNTHIPQVGASPFEFARCALTLRRLLASTILPLPSDNPIRERYRKTALSKDRYAMVIDHDLLKTAISSVAATADETIAFATPNNIEAFDQYGYDLPRFKAGSAEMTKVCAETGVKCVDLSSRMASGNFYDIVHLNTRGNENFAKLLLQVVTGGPN